MTRVLTDIFYRQREEKGEGKDKKQSADSCQHQRLGTEQTSEMKAVQLQIATTGKDNTLQQREKKLMLRTEPNKNYQVINRGKRANRTVTVQNTK